MADPEVIGHYRLIAPIAQGSMGKVYLVEHEVTKRKLALKLLKPELFGGERARQRFLLEARAAGIEHPNLIQVTDAGEEDDQLYIVMRYVRGSDLGKALRAGPLPPQRVASILSQIASALDASHNAGLIHRDVKPSNILVTSSEDPEGPDHAFLCDFGITKDAEGPALTQTGFAPGTRAYMAPEQFKGQGIAGTSDQYALACVAFEALTGRRPFEAATEETLMYMHLSEDPPTATSVNHRLGANVDRVLSKAMAKDPASRYPSCVAFTDALQEAIDSIETTEAPVDFSETPTVIGSIAPETAAEPAAPTRSKRGPQIVLGALAILGIVLVIIGAMLAFSSKRSSAPPTATPIEASATPDIPSPSPMTPTPSPPASPEPVLTVAQARLAGPYHLAIDYTGSRGLSRGGGAPFWSNWPIVMKPICAHGACNVKIDFHRFGVIAKGTLQRHGSTYSGILSTLGISTCNGRDSYGTLGMILKVHHATMNGSTWRADQLSGRTKYSTDPGDCIPVAWTADVVGNARS